MALSEAIKNGLSTLWAKLVAGVGSNIANKALRWAAVNGHVDTVKVLLAVPYQMVDKPVLV